MTLPPIIAIYPNVNTAVGVSDHGAWANGTLTGNLDGARHVIFRGDWLIDQTPLNLTGYRDRVTFDFRDAHFTANVPGKTAVEMYDSSGCTVMGLNITGICAVFLGTGRVAEQAYRSAGKNRFYDCRIDGAASKAAVYNCAAENDHWLDCRVVNDAPGALAALALEHDNIMGITSQFGLTIGNDTSHTGWTWDGGEIGADGLGMDATLLVRGFDRVRLDKPYIRSTVAPHIVLDSTETTVGNFEARALYTHGATPGGSELGGKPDYSIVTRGVQPIEGTVIQGGRIAANVAPMYLGPLRHSFALLDFMGNVAPVEDPAARFGDMVAIKWRDGVRLINWNTIGRPHYDDGILFGDNQGFEWNDGSGINCKIRGSSGGGARRYWVQSDNITSQELIHPPGGTPSMNFPGGGPPGPPGSSGTGGSP